MRKGTSQLNVRELGAQSHDHEVVRHESTETNEDGTGGGGGGWNQCGRSVYNRDEAATESRAAVKVGASRGENTEPMAVKPPPLESSSGLAFSPAHLAVREAAIDRAGAPFLSRKNREA